MGVSTPRRRRPPAHKKKSLFLKRSSSSAASNDVPTPRTLERRTIQKESLANLFSELNLSPGPFSLQSVKSEQKDWKLRATALQSPQVRRLCRNLQKRKQLVRSFTRNAGYGDIFKRTERSKEDEAHRFMLETALSYSPVELVARNLIDKVANNYQRERHGVWSQLGRPYSCLGVPAISIPKEHPNPKEIEHINAAEEISPFFQSTSKPIVVCNLSMARTVPVLMKKSGLFLEGSRSHLNLQCLLLKMGLSHLHDVAHTKFPKKPLEISNHLRKTVRVNTPFSQVMSEKSSPFQSSGPFSQQSIQLTDFRAASFQRLATITPQVDGNAQSVPSTESVEHTNDNAYMGLELPHTGQEVFEWTRQFLTLRKGLQERLNDKLLARAIRREQCRSCPPFTAEVSSKLLVHMEESCSRQTPILTQHLWKLAEENQGRKRPTSAPLLPEVESISNFYERVCLFVNNQRDDDPLMEVLVHRLKELLESGFKLQKELLSSLCYYMGHLPENVTCTGRMSSVMPILYFICKELRVPSTDYYMLLRNSRLDRFHGNSKNLASTTSN